MIKQIETLKKQEGTTSLTYVAADSLKDYDLISQDPFVILGYDEEACLFQVHYHTQDIMALIKVLDSIKVSFVLPFVAEEHLELFRQQGYKIFVHYVEYRLQDFVGQGSYRVMTHEAEDLSRISKACRFVTRGFQGQSPEWFELWQRSSLASQANLRSANVLVTYLENRLVGFAAVGIYDQTLWIRELAVDPDYHKMGVGKDLMSQALSYGTDHHATKGFLMADALNQGGDHLYQAFGFLPTTEGQIDMIKFNRTKTLDIYLGKTVDVIIDRPMGKAHPKHPDMIYPINYGYIPNTRSGDNQAIDVYVIDLDHPVKQHRGKVIALIRRRDDQEEKLVVASRSYDRETIRAKVNFTEQYFDSEIVMGEL